MKKTLTFLLALALCCPIFAQNESARAYMAQHPVNHNRNMTDFPSSDIQFWVGNGTNEAVIVFYWCQDTEIGLAYGYRWNGIITIGTMLNDLMAADNRLSIDMSETLINTYSYTDYEGDLLNFNYKVGEIEEKNKLVLLDVPITLSYTTGNLFAHAGLKVGVPIKLKYDQTLNDCDFTCEIPAYNTTMNHGIALGLEDKTSTFNGEFSSSPIMMMFTADAGYRFSITDKISIGAGIYFDKALYRIKFKADSDENNIQYAKNKTVYDFLKTSNPKDESEMPAYLIHSSVLSGQKTSTKQRIAESLGYTNLGFKITVTFDRYGKDYYPNNEDVNDYYKESTLSSDNEQ